MLNDVPRVAAVVGASVRVEQPAEVSGRLERLILPNDGVVSRLMLHATSAAVIGSPFEKTRPFRSLKVRVSLWFVSFHDVAWSGITTLFDVISKSWP